MGIVGYHRSAYLEIVRHGLLSTSETFEPQQIRDMIASLILELCPSYDTTQSLPLYRNSLHPRALANAESNFKFSANSYPNSLTTILKQAFGFCQPAQIVSTLISIGTPYECTWAASFDM